MSNLNPRQFFHGSATPGLEEILPARESGVGTNYQESNPKAAYVTNAEDIAWSWASAVGRKQASRREVALSRRESMREDPTWAAAAGDLPIPDAPLQRVYEVEPEGEVEPDANFSSDTPENFETTRARVVREHRGPRGSQFALFPDREGREYAMPYEVRGEPSVDDPDDPYSPENLRVDTRSSPEQRVARQLDLAHVVNEDPHPRLFTEHKPFR